MHEPLVLASELSGWAKARWPSNQVQQECKSIDVDKREVKIYANCDRNMSQRSPSVTPMQSVLAGAAAGGIESMVTVCKMTAKASFRTGPNKSLQVPNGIRKN
jgi:hypothetical protein